MKDSDPYIPLDYELLVRGEGEEKPRVVHDTYCFGMTVPQYNLELFQSGENIGHKCYTTTRKLFRGASSSGDGLVCIRVGCGLGFGVMDAVFHRLLLAR